MILSCHNYHTHTFLSNGNILTVYHICKECVNKTNVANQVQISPHKPK